MRVRSTRGSESCPPVVVTASCGLNGLDVWTMPRTTTGPVAVTVAVGDELIADRGDPAAVDDHRGAVGEHATGVSTSSPSSASCTWLRNSTSCAAS